MYACCIRIIYLLRSSMVEEITLITMMLFDLKMVFAKGTFAIFKHGREQVSGRYFMVFK